MMAPEKYIADFIRDNIDYLHKKDLEGMYAQLEHYDRKHLTQVLMESGIDPLKFVVKIPKSYASTLPIETIKFGKRNKVIGAKAFSNCDQLETLIIPEGIELIGVMSFFACSNLNVVHLPKSLKTLSRRAFDGCTQIDEITFDGTMEEFEELNPGDAFPPNVANQITVTCSDGEASI
jgi:hypothetical protein